VVFALSPRTSGSRLRRAQRVIYSGIARASNRGIPMNATRTTCTLYRSAGVPFCCKYTHFLATTARRHRSVPPLPYAACATFNSYRAEPSCQLFHVTPPSIFSVARNISQQLPSTRLRSDACSLPRFCYTLYLSPFFASAVAFCAAAYFYHSTFRCWYRRFLVPHLRGRAAAYYTALHSDGCAFLRAILVDRCPANLVRAFHS